MNMNEKQQRFCQEYVIDLNATQAAIRAGYSARTAYAIGHKLLKKAEIQERISELQGDLQKATGITAIRVLTEHKKIAFSSIADLHQSWISRKDFEELTDDEKSAIKSISVKVTKRNVGTRQEPEIADVELVKIELYDKQKSLDSIANLLNFTAPVQTEEEGGFKLRPLTKDEINYLIELNKNY